MNKYDQLLRPHIRSIKPYSSARDEYTGKEGIFLDANENPYGSVTHNAYNRYPDPYQKLIKEKLAPMKNVVAEQIFLGNGSDEPIDLLIRAFCEPGKDEVIIMPPTYGMYKVSADINNVSVKEVPLSPEFQIQVEDVIANSDSNTKLIFICSPNNPSGNAMKMAHVEKILNNFGGIVVIDEAYIDFYDAPSWTERLGEFENLVVLQTFSKAWGLAALRLGMAFAHADLINVLNKIKPPYNINAATQSLALEALDKSAVKDKMVQDILSEKENLASALSEVPEIQTVYPSDANFLLVKIADAHGIYQKLIQHLVIVRDRSKVKLCDDCLRITVGTEEENRMFLKYLKEILN